MAGCIVLDVLLVALHFDQNEVKKSKVKVMTKYSHKGGRTVSYTHLTLPTILRV